MSKTKAPLWCLNGQRNTTINVCFIFVVEKFISIMVNNRQSDQTKQQDKTKFSMGKKGLIKVIFELVETHSSIPRLHKLSNNDVIEVNGIMLEFEDNILYEVRRVREWFTVEYRRTGKSYTPEEVNELV